MIGVLEQGDIQMGIAVSLIHAGDVQALEYFLDFTLAGDQTRSHCARPFSIRTGVPMACTPNRRAKHSAIGSKTLLAI